MTRMPDFEEFKGDWVLTRIISDRRSGAEGHLDGQANFNLQADDTYLYHEEGKLKYAGQAPMAATRKYIWKAVADGIDVLFEDGRPFHKIELTKLMPDANHHCDPDLYHVSYDFTSWPKWRAAWRVVGPKKDYRMLSSYSRP